MMRGIRVNKSYCGGKTSDKDNSHISILTLRTLNSGTFGKAECPNLVLSCPFIDL